MYWDACHLEGLVSAEPCRQQRSEPRPCQPLIRKRIGVTREYCSPCNLQGNPNVGSPSVGGVAHPVRGCAGSRWPWLGEALQLPDTDIQKPTFARVQAALLVAPPMTSAAWSIALGLLRTRSVGFATSSPRAQVRPFALRVQTISFSDQRSPC